MPGRADLHAGRHFLPLILTKRGTSGGTARMRQMTDQPSRTGGSLFSSRPDVERRPSYVFRIKGYGTTVMVQVLS